MPRFASAGALPTLPPDMALPKGTLLVGQSGGPTAVINQSLVGVIETARELLIPKRAVTKIIGMRFGVNGLVNDDLVDFTRHSPETLERVANTPSAALGSSRDKPDADYCAHILQSCRKLNARYFFYIGGNDSSDTCRIVSELAASEGYDMHCFHVPKTIDNDLVGSDHTPGFPSSARFQAMAFMSDSMDNASLPGVKINVVMGRHAGFLTASAALARGIGKQYSDHNGPHLIYVPEVPFDSQQFLKDVEAVYRRLGRCQVAVSEGIQDSAGRAIATTLVQNLDKDAHGNVQLSGVGALGDALADLVKREMKIGVTATSPGKAPRTRADTFGYLQRCWPDVSPIDAKEARQSARFAVKMAARGELSGSIAIVRGTPNSSVRAPKAAKSAATFAALSASKLPPYTAAYKLLALSDVAAKTRHMPREYLKDGNDVTPAFIEYVLPLVGKLPVMERV